MHVLRRRAGERRHAGEHLVREHAGGVDVRPLVHVGIARRLLGRHVRGRPQRDAERGERGPGARPGRRACEPPPSRAADTAFATPKSATSACARRAGRSRASRRGGRCRARARRPVRRRTSRRMRSASSHAEASPRGQPLAERLALHERHDVVERPSSVARVDEGEDVRMEQLRGDLDLAQEALGADARGESGRSTFTATRAVVPQVVARGRRWPCRRGRARARGDSGRRPCAAAARALRRFPCLAPRRERRQVEPARRDRQPRADERSAASRRRVAGLVRSPAARRAASGPMRGDLGLLLGGLTRSRGAAENCLVLCKGVSRGARGGRGGQQRHWLCCSPRSPRAPRETAEQ